MRLIPPFLLLLLAISAPVRADEVPRDLGLVLFDEWPRDIPMQDDAIPVRWAVPKSPAALGGFKPGDLLLNIDLFAVTKEDLVARWVEKSRGAAGCNWPPTNTGLS